MFPRNSRSRKSSHSDTPLTDPRFENNPLVTQEPNIRFYAGFPVLSPATQLPVGTLCVIHNQPHTLTDDQIESLKILAQQVEHLFTLRENSKTLIAQQRELEEAVRSKSLFLSTMSHEIRTPINGILGSAQLLNTSKMDKDNQRHVNTILSCGTVLLDLINNILDLSKLNSQKMAPSLEPVKLRSLVNQVVNVTHPYLIDKPKLSIHVEIEPNLPQSLFLDPSLTRQILLNLLSNACKFSSEGVISISAKLKSNRLLLSVKDPGSGISEEDQATIFEPFNQGKNTHNTQAGSGLGLSIIKLFTELLGGEIMLNSVINQGSTFTVSLPLKEAPSYTSTSNVSQPAPANTLLNKTILVADDVEVNLLVIKALLDKLGCKVIAANNGKELLSFLGRDIDLILTDIHMPEMDGYQASSAWRETDAKTPIVALTADITPETTVRCNEAGITSILTKPVSLEELKNCLMQHIA